MSHIFRYSRLLFTISCNHNSINTEQLLTEAYIRLLCWDMLFTVTDNVRKGQLMRERERERERER